MTSIPRISLLICVILTPAISAPEVLDRTEIADLFSQGKDFFRQANELAAKDPPAAKELYLKAALRFERIARDGGIRNGKLDYNIGNTYFRMGDIGRAILYYRRAGRLTPNDPNLRQNLAHARTKVFDKIETKERTRVLKTLFFWHYDLSSKARLTLFAVFLGAASLLAGVRLFRKGAGSGWLLIVSALIAALLLGSLAAEAVARSQNLPGVVLADEVTARKGDAETYQPSFDAPLHSGTEFEVVEDRQQWLLVELADGRRCWLPADSIGLVD